VPGHEGEKEIRYIKTCQTVYFEFQSGEANDGGEGTGGERTLGENKVRQLFTRSQRKPAEKAMTLTGGEKTCKNWRIVLKGGPKFLG